MSWRSWGAVAPNSTVKSPVDRASARLLAVAAAVTGLGVALGAFGAHGLRESLDADRMRIYETGVQYHLVHGLAAVLAAGLAERVGRPARTAGWLFLAGILVFSGSLYVLAVTGTRWLGAITPLGGVAFLTGWGWVAVAAVRTSARS